MSDGNILTPDEIEALLSAKGEELGIERIKELAQEINIPISGLNKKDAISKLISSAQEMSEDIKGILEFNQRSLHYPDLNEKNKTELEEYNSHLMLVLFELML
jgi:hypothetical protein